MLLRWVYTLGVLLIGFSAGLYPTDEMTLHFALTAQLLMLLTYPFGIVGTLAYMPLIYTGIATPAEALAASSPLFALAGWLQWFRALPWLIRRATTRSSSLMQAEEDVHKNEP
jgi:hypothetical protein